MANLTASFNLQPHDVISFVGGGGKTTAILRLAREFARAGKRAIITTTTRVGPGQVPGHKLFVVGPASRRLPAASLKHIEAHFARQPVAVVIGQERPVKLIGVHPDLVSDLRPLAQCVLVEADGARSRPLKAPAPYEPVWPPVTTVAVAVIGIDAVGAPLDPASTHRPERVAAVTGLGLGAPITPQAVASCVLHSEGLFARAPQAARRVALINKVKTEAQRDLAGEIADRLSAQDPNLLVVIANVRVEAVRVWRSTI